eukprot:2832530-Amphidinium_carterae.1
MELFTTFNRHWSCYYSSVCRLKPLLAGSSLFGPSINLFGGSTSATGELAITQCKQCHHVACHASASRLASTFDSDKTSVHDHGQAQSHPACSAFQVPRFQAAPQAQLRVPRRMQPHHTLIMPREVWPLAHREGWIACSDLLRSVGG